MKILLMNPPARRFVRCQHPSFPLGLGYVASALVADGHEVDIYDAEWGPDFPAVMKPVEHPLQDMALHWHRYFEALNAPQHPVWTEVRQVLRERDPDVLGITCRVLDLASARVVAGIAKSLNPAVRIVLGGPATSTCGEMIWQSEHVDFAVRGEGEITAVELLRALQRGGRCEGILGLSYRASSGVVHNPARPLIEDLGTLPYPARERLLFTDWLPKRKVEFMMGEVVSSRGCPYRCGFCAIRSVWGGGGARMRKPDDVVAEVRRQHDQYGARFITFWDDLFTADRARAIALCDRLREMRAGVQWLCLVRANTIDDDLLARMKDAGCVQVQMGVESGSDRILRKMRKGIRLARMRRAAEMIHRAGLSFHAFLLIGIPSETREEIQATMRLIPELDPDVVELSVFSPYPGSPFYEELRAADRLSEQDWLTADFLNIGRCHTGTLSAEEYRELALSCLRECDEHNNRKARQGRPAADIGSSAALPGAPADRSSPRQTRRCETVAESLGGSH